MSTPPYNSAGTELVDSNATSTPALSSSLVEPPTNSPSETIEENGTTDHADVTDEAAVLDSFIEGVRDQDELERDIAYHASKALIKKDDERDQKRLDRIEASRAKIASDMEKLKKNAKSSGLTSVQRKKLDEEIGVAEKELVSMNQEIDGIRKRIDDRQKEAARIEAPLSGRNMRLSNESQRDFLIRTGKITPFSRIRARDVDEDEGGLTDALMNAEEEVEAQAVLKEEMNGPESHQDFREPGFRRANEAEAQSHVNLKRPGFVEIDESRTLAEEDFGLRPRKKRRDRSGRALSTALVTGEDDEEPSHVPAESESEEAFTPPSSESEPVSAIEDELDDGSAVETKASKKRKAIGEVKAEKVVDVPRIDDGSEQHYQKRLSAWVQKRSTARKSRMQQQVTFSTDSNDHAAADVNTLEVPGSEAEWFKPSPDAPDYELNDGLKQPGDIHPALFDYQKTGVKWLAELYEQEVGGIVGDEMGLGKTIQIIAFLASLHYSKRLDKPVLIVAPATVLKQWVNEFHLWWPPMRVSILHSSGSGMLDVRREGRIEDDDVVYHGDKKKSKTSRAAKRIVDKVVKHGHVLVTTYAGLQTYSDVLIPVNWGYAVLDEGHKIRNPNTEVTIYCKELRTPNRVILSGTPIQNNLVELWSLFDFIYPMRLGTLVNFRTQFEMPIRQGGYANATNLEIMTAQQCAQTLKDAISPYLLQRLKVDVAADLPKKTEQVVFCKLTKPQVDSYERYLQSRDVQAILSRERLSFSGIDVLRKICNHPDLVDPILKRKPGYRWGSPNKSGKMQVVKALLEIWKKAGDKILLFSQGVQMLDILENFVKTFDGINYLRMDGGTSIKIRQSLVDRFNNDPEINLFLLTTKVGGLGVNLTGGNRVIIFDPDWNPSTDVQARERAWRLGQKKEVTIYRLMSAGTIEEKIYHRQIFKQFLTDKVLKDPKSRQSFQHKDLYDLFTLGDIDEDDTETSRMFEGSEVKTEEEQKLRNFIGVEGLEKYHDDTAEKKGDSDQRIMDGIFARAEGVHNILHHDRIVNLNGKPIVQADVSTLQREAKRMAAEAAAELRRSAEAARHVPIGTVTWTGEVGEAGRPENIRRRGGPSSASILNGLSARQGIRPGGSGAAGTVGGSGNSSRSGTPGSASASASSRRPPDSQVLITRIRDFIRVQGDSVPSQMLANHFNHMIRTAQDKEEFLAMLREVAELKKPANSSMRGKWVLKDEYR